MDVLKEKFYREYNTLSRYSPFPCYYNTLDNKYMMGSVTNLDQISNYTIYEVQHGESYDLVALKAYGNPTYYWIICNYNFRKRNLEGFIFYAYGNCCSIFRL